MAELTEVLKQYYKPQCLVIARRVYFHRREQAVDETITEYIVELRKLAAPCEFGACLNEALQDRLVCVIRSENIQKWLLSEAELSLTKAISIA